MRVDSIIGDGAVPETVRQWLVYMIRADDGRYYTGITTDLKRRWREHTSSGRGAKFFRGRKPDALIYVETGHDRSSASRREAAIKQLERAQKQQLAAALHNALNAPGGAQLLSMVRDASDD